MKTCCDSGIGACEIQLSGGSFCPHGRCIKYAEDADRMAALEERIKALEAATRHIRLNVRTDGLSWWVEPSGQFVSGEPVCGEPSTTERAGQMDKSP